MKSRGYLSELRSSGFLRSVSVLVSGTAMANGILLLALPVVTRLYSPSDFSMLAVFGAMLSIVAVTACLRFEVAIPIPEQSADAANLFGLATVFAVLVSSIAALCVYVFPDPLVSLVKQPLLKPFLWLLPAGVLLAGLSTALQFWFVRKREFAAIARARVGQSIAVVTTQLACGWLGLAPLGLVVAQVFNSGASALGLGNRLVRHNDNPFRMIHWRRMCSMFVIYQRFPKYSTFEALTNSAGMHLPILMIAALAAKAEAGFLVFAMYAIQAPMGLIGGAIAQVYLSRAPDEYRAGQLGAFTASIVGGLLRAGVGPLVFAGLIAPNAFAIVFGEEWRRAGVLVSWMTPWFIVQFLTVPVSMALHVTNHQKSALVLQFGGLAARVAFVWLAASLLHGFHSEAFALSGVVFYLAYLFVVLRAASVKRGDVLGRLHACLPVIIWWSISGIAVSQAMRFVFNEYLR